MWRESGALLADVLIEGGRVAAVEGGLKPRDGDEVIDASGLDVFPGFLDIHVHAGDRIGPYELADSWASAAQLALRNGVTTLFGFVTQQPGETLTEALHRCRARSAGAACEVRFHLTPTRWPWDWSEIETLMGDGFRTFKLYTTYRDAGLFTPYDRLAEAMGQLAPRGGRVLVHCEDEATLAEAARCAVNFRDPFSHALLRPPAAEVAAVRRVVDLAHRTGCPTHVVHVSTAEGASVVAAARAAGAPVSCETAPHYLLLSDDCLRHGDGHRFLCTPPLRGEAVREALVEQVLAGAVDCLATDHCPFRRDDKDAGRGDIRAVPNGLPGVGALVPLTFEALVMRYGMPVARWAAALTCAPARVVGLDGELGVVQPGARGDLVLLARTGPPQPVQASLADVYDPYRGASTSVSVRWVIREGRVVLRPGARHAP